MKPTILDLFSGIGGFSIGLERAGFKTIAFCEKDPYCREVLKKHWKSVKLYGDVKEITKTKLKADGIESPTIITGGVPCQPFSVAGLQKGTSDSRYLWPEMFRIIKDFKSEWVIVENVRGLINIQDGVVFERLCADLETEGYQIQTFNIPAAGVGAPHRRERVWVVGYSEHNGSSSTTQSRSTSTTGNYNTQGKDATWKFEGTGRSNNSETMANSRDIGRRNSIPQGSKGNGRGELDSEVRTSKTASTSGSSEREKIMANTLSGKAQTGRERQREIRKRHQEEGVSDNVTSGSKVTTNQKNWWDIEPDVGRVVDGVQGRTHRLRGLGNAIIPKIAEEIGKAIIKTRVL